MNVVKNTITTALQKNKQPKNNKTAKYAISVS